MKKFTILLISAMFVLGGLFVVQPAKATGEVVDQQFVPGYNPSPTDHIFFSACTRFKPTRSTYANYFDLAVKNDQGAAYPGKASIRPAAADITVPGDIIKSFTQTTFNNWAMSQGMSRFTASAGNITIDTSKYYFLCIDDFPHNNATGWFYTDPVAGGYSRLGYGNDVQNSRDNVTYGFKTYGYDAAGPTPTPSTGAGSNNRTGSTGTSRGTSGTVSTGGAPSNNISSALATPKTLLAAYSPENKAITVVWSASATTDIVGYNVYRTEASGKDYKKIGATTKTVVVYNDKDIATGKTYYYMVRAYKGNYESASSNEVFATVPTPTPSVTVTKSATPTPATTSKTKISTPLLIGIIAGILILLALLILLLLLRRRKQRKDTNPEKTIVKE